MLDDKRIKHARREIALDKAKVELEYQRENLLKLKAKRQAIETAKIGAAEAEKRAAEKHLKEIAVYDLNLEKGELSRQLDQVIVDQRSREERMVLACDWNHNTYAFDAEVDAESVHLCMQQINQWIRQAPKGETLDIVGGGSRAGLGRPPEGARRLSSARLNGIVFHEPAEMVLRAKAGTPLAVVVAALEAHGQMLPFEPIDHRALLGGG